LNVRERGVRQSSGDPTRGERTDGGRWRPIGRTGLALAATLIGCAPVLEEPPPGSILGWYVVVGRHVGDGSECMQGLYRGTATAAPELIWCPEEDGMRWLDDTAPLPPETGTLAVVTEVDGRYGAYPEYESWEPWIDELRAVDLSSGADALLHYHLGDSGEGLPTGSIGSYLGLPDGAVLADLRAEDEAQPSLVRFEPDGARSDDLMPGWIEREILALYGDEVLVQANDGAGDGGLFAIEGEQLRRIGEGLQPGTFRAVGPDGDALLFQHGDGASILRGDELSVADASGFDFWSDLLGWDHDGNVLFEHDGGLWSWDGVDGTAPQQVLSGDLSFSWQTMVRAGRTLLVQSQDDGDFRVPAWYADGALTPCGIAADSMTGPAWLRGGQEPAIVYGERGWDSGDEGRLALCLPDGSTSWITDVPPKFRFPGDQITPGAW